MDENRGADAPLNKRVLPAADKANVAGNPSAGEDDEPCQISPYLWPCAVTAAGMFAGNRSGTFQDLYL
jgi:hypothetical protein